MTVMRALDFNLKVGKKSKKNNNGKNKKIQEKKRQCTDKLFLQSIIYRSYIQTYV